MEELENYNNLLKVFLKEKPPETLEEKQIEKEEKEKKKPKKKQNQIFFMPK